MYRGFLQRCPSAWRGLSGVQSDFFTSNGTWTKPGGCTSVTIICQGSGGGGGSGRRGAASSVRAGGGGGGGGGRTEVTVPASALAATEAVVTGAGGSGGVGFAISGPASPTRVSMRSSIPGSNAASVDRFFNGYDGLNGGATLWTTTSPFTSGNFAQIWGVIKPSASGTVIVRFRPEAAAQTVTVKAGSTLEYF